MFRAESIFIKKLMKKSSSNNVMQLRKSIVEGEKSTKRTSKKPSAPKPA